MVLLCDGRLVCGCADPYGRRVLGYVRQDTVTAVWTGTIASSLRRDLNSGGSKFCGDCPLKLPLTKDQTAPQRDLNVPPLPSPVVTATVPAATDVAVDIASTAAWCVVRRRRRQG